MAKEYGCQDYEFDYTPRFEPTRMSPKKLEDGTIFTPCTLEGAVFYGVFLSVFDPNEEVPKYVPDVPLNHEHCPWPNN